MQLGGYKLLVLRTLVVALTVLWTGTVAARPEVVGVRLGVHPEKTRIVLDLTGPPAYRIAATSRPNRLVIDLDDVEWRVPAAGTPVGRGLVKAIHIDPGLNGDSQMILELVAPARVLAHEVLAASGSAPTRLFIDLEKDSAIAPVEPAAKSSQGTLSVSGPAAAATAVGPIGQLIPPAKPVARRPAAERLTLSLVAMTVSPGVLPPAKPPASEVERRPVIAIDAGHGGRDPGAIGIDGTMEKDITLHMARELKGALDATGRYETILTRSEDDLLALRQRIEIARMAGADLFISLHADHNYDETLRGASVYTLSETASDAEAAALAARENKETLITGVDLSNQSAMVTSILIDLAQRETKNLSSRFASLLTEEMGDQTVLLRDSHRFAGFAVLKAPDVPSVLIELGYLSNEKDETALRSTWHRARLARAIREAIDGYFEWQRSVRHS